MSVPRACPLLIIGTWCFLTLFTFGWNPTSSLAQLTPQSQSGPPEGNLFVARVYYAEKSDLDRLASWLDIWEVNPAQGYLITILDSDAYQTLVQQGNEIWIDQPATVNLHKPMSYSPAQKQGIPGFLCYRTVEETYADLITLANERPDLVSLYDIGDSWEKRTSESQAGYDIYVLVIGARDKQYSEDKPKLFVLGAIHARELATAEMAMRFAEYLVSNYSTDPDIAWLLDHFEVHILPIANPDGRKLAEMGYYQRKNTNNANGGQCSTPPTAINHYGTDLNRNHTYQWGGSSVDPCSAVYQGPSSASEPETQAIETYLRNIFVDQREDGEDQPAPLSTSGVFISLHSYGQLILWPWGYTDSAPPNAVALTQLGKRLATFNHYYPTQSFNLYRTTGDSDDFVYGELGIAAYTFEMGTAFFQDCSTFESAIYPDNLKALLYAARVARRPYQLPFGPEISQVRVEPNTVLPGDVVLLSATALTTTETAQAIVAARASLDLPSWLAETTYPVQAEDGSFDEPQEELHLILDTTTWTPGRNILFVEGQDDLGNWGPPTTTFVWVRSNTPNSLLYFFPLIRKH